MSRNSKFVAARALAVVMLGVLSVVGVTGAATTSSAGSTSWCC